MARLMKIRLEGQGTGLAWLDCDDLTNLNKLFGFVTDSESFVLPEEAYDALYDSAQDANQAAKDFVELQLQQPLHCKIARQEQVSNGDLPHGYQLPPADSVAKQVAMIDGRGTYTGSLPFFCDPYGADVWTVCETTFTIRVVVEGDTSPPPCAAAAASVKKAASKSRQPKAASSSKAASKSTAISKPRRGGGAKILSVPGLTKKEVAALNKAARSSAKRMAAGSDSD